jgi:hypothetical protein
MNTRTIALDSKNLEAGIEAHSRAARAFGLTLFERIAYHTLMISVDVAAWCLLPLLVMHLASYFIDSSYFYGFEGLVLAALPLLVFALAVTVGVVSLALNIPLLRKLDRERARLKKLGLSSLSKSLWKESRRSRWRSRARGVLLVVDGILLS